MTVGPQGSPEHQGKGIGSNCMFLIMEEARQSGLPVRLRVLKVNVRALAFYQRRRFVRTGGTETRVLMEAVAGHDALSL